VWGDQFSELHSSWWLQSYGWNSAKLVGVFSAFSAFSIPAKAFPLSFKISSNHKKADVAKRGDGLVI
jgi:hypothetical protein